MLISVNGLLTSSKVNDAISEELAELLGFEELELVMHILQERSQVAHEASLLCAAHSTASDPFQLSRHLQSAESQGSALTKQDRVIGEHEV